MVGSYIFYILGKQTLVICDHAKNTWEVVGLVHRNVAIVRRTPDR